MTMNSTTLTYTIGGIDEIDAFGCGYVTVMMATDKSHIQEILNRVSLQILGDDIISVVEMNGVYAIYCELYLIPSEKHKKEILDMGIVIFDAKLDDADIDVIICVDGYQHCTSNNISEHDMDDEIKRLDDFDTEFEDDDEIQRIEHLSCAIDFYSRIIEYNRDKAAVDTVLEKLIHIKNQMETNGFQVFQP